MINNQLFLRGKIYNTLNIGDAFGGGYVGYLYQQGDPGYIQGEQHGIIVSPNIIPKNPYLPSGFSWGTQNAPITPQPVITGLSVSIGTGFTNSNLISNTYDSGGPTIIHSAAYEALVYTANGYSDWCLGSLDDMIAITANRAYLPNWNPVNPNWTSSQFNRDNAYIVDGSGNQQVVAKALYEYYADVRPVRYF